MNAEHVSSMAASILAGKVRASEMEILDAVRLARNIWRVANLPPSEIEAKSRALRGRVPLLPLMENIQSKGPLEINPGSSITVFPGMGILPDQIQIKRLWSELLDHVVPGAKKLSESAIAGAIFRFLREHVSVRAHVTTACDEALKHYSHAHKIFEEIVPLHKSAKGEAVEDFAAAARQHKQIFRLLEVNKSAFAVLKEHLQDHSMRVTPNAKRALLSLGLDLDKAWEHLMRAHTHLKTCRGVGDIKAAVGGKRGGRPRDKAMEPAQTCVTSSKKKSHLDDELAK